MSTTFPFTSPDSLKEIAFNGGSTQDLVFAVYDSSGNPINLSGGTITWYLAYYSNPSVSVVSKNGTSGSATNQFRVRLAASDTVALSGKFKQQYLIVDSSGSSYRSTGMVTIFPAIV
jgi:hypothetical protein